MKTGKKKITRFVILLILVILILFLRFTEEIGYDQHLDDRFKISKVIDGDTMILAGGDKLRLLSVDTPEKGELFFQKAKDMISNVALYNTGRIEFASLRRDRYGRLLGYLYIDTLFINRMILDSGLGYLYLFKNTDINCEETIILLNAQQRAIKDRRGIWSIEKNEEEYYINRIGSFRLHRPGCRTLSNINEKDHRKIYNRLEAFAEGLSPCRICKP